MFSKVIFLDKTFFTKFTFTIFIQAFLFLSGYENVLNILKIKMPSSVKTHRKRSKAILTKNPSEQENLVQAVEYKKSMMDDSKKKDCLSIL